ncbi:hypothetical protein Pcinc_037956 [Petrolisthes cinctipes]|uniref:PNPLA domain-containing protein n=1 Tax=Petrolisthes cinctipes TaxID=88211 RepID=A0AAE1EKU9_PETCI|nr:hypothetical protein Pcinc_037956 [Petrolisthes cinctipes]
MAKNILLSQFDTREELVQAVLCSAFIPGFSGWASSRFRGVRYIDGGFSDNLPQLDNLTITVCPFSGESDICPRDSKSNNLMQAVLCSCFVPGFSGWLPPLFRGVRYLDGVCSNNIPQLGDRTVTVSPFAGHVDICPRDRDQLLYTALLCSAFIPGFSGWICPRVNGVRYVDGGFSNNLPEMDNHTVIVSPFCGEADICPHDPTAGLVTINLANTSIELSKENLYRFARILFPPPPEVLSKMCQQGFNDALDFLQRNNLINCTSCLAVQSRFSLTDTREEEDEETTLSVPVPHYDCSDCHRHRKEAILEGLPEAVGGILQDAINTANQGLMNWVFKHKSMKLLSVITLPYVLPIDIAYSAFLKFMASAPTAKDIQSLGKQLVTLIQALIRFSSAPASVHHHHHHIHESKFSCQLAITQFTGDSDLQHINNRQNFDFMVDLENNDGSITLPDSHKEAMLLESQALNEIALRCASRSVSRAGSRMASRVASRAVSRAVSRRTSVTDSVDIDIQELGGPLDAASISDDAFEKILDVTTHQDALMAYYYLDENNQVRVTEIFDMSHDEATTVSDMTCENSLEVITTSYP